MPKLSFTELVLKATKSIEKTLASKYGATGQGLLSKLASVKIFYISPELKESIRKIGQVRNKLTHEEGYVFTGDQELFLKECQWASDTLKVAAESLKKETSHMKTISTARISEEFIIALKKVVTLNRQMLNMLKEDNVTH